VTRPPTGPALDIEAFAEPVAAAVLACPAVARLSGGPFGAVGTYLPGRRVAGVQITTSVITVRLVARPVALRTLENQVRAAVTAVVPGLPIHIGLDDLDVEPG
jgi:hypothetical protein